MRAHVGGPGCVKPQFFGVLVGPEPVFSHRKPILGRFGKIEFSTIFDPQTPILTSTPQTLIFTKNAMFGPKTPFLAFLTPRNRFGSIRR